MALLVTATELERGRQWVRERLWSDRAPVEGARSLRQELTHLRKRLNGRHAVLRADRKRIWLDADLVTLSKHASDNPRELFEGMDIRDEAFNHWLAVTRSATNATGSALRSGVQSGAGQPLRTIALVPDLNAEKSQRLAELEFFDSVSRSLRETMDATVLTALPAIPEPGTLLVSTQVLAFDGTAPSLRITLDELEKQGTVWTETLRDWMPGQSISRDHRVLAIVCRLVEAIEDRWAARQTLSWKGGNADAMAHLAVRKIFTVDATQIDEAEELLRQAYEIEPRGVYQAWRAQLLTFRFVERFSDDREGLLEEARAASALALHSEPTNSFVLAAVANSTTILERNIVGGGELAQLAIRTNPANPFAWWALSNARQYANDTEAAYEAAVRTQLLSANTAFRFWGDFQRALAAAITGRLDEAIRLGETASVLAPNFRPPLRYLIALYALREDNAAAQRCIDLLSRKETDFTLEQLLRNPDYPVSVMRQNDLIHPDRLKAVADDGKA